MLYASPRNPGAQAAAREMKSAYQGDVGVVSEAAWDGWQCRRRSGRLWASMGRGLGGGVAETSSDRAPSGQSAKQSSEPTHFLLYLNLKTFVGAEGEKLAKEVRRARLEKKLPVILVHENDQADGRDGCEFAHFFGTTPSDLIDGGLYATIAVAFMPSRAHRRVSYALCGKLLGATNGQKGLQQVLVQSERRVSNALNRLSAWRRSVSTALKGLNARRVRRVPRGTTSRGTVGHGKDTVLVGASAAATEMAEPSAGPGAGASGGAEQSESPDGVVLAIADTC